jgi:hypothetical protein
LSKIDQVFTSGATYEDFLGMIDTGSHLPLNENQPTNKFLKKFIAKAQGLQ